MPQLTSQDLIYEALQDKPPNYKLAYMLVFQFAGSLSTMTATTATFGKLIEETKRMLDTLDQKK